MLVVGDHSIAVGTAAGLARAYRAHGQKIGLIWVDAHADMNTPETTTTGNVHGMGLACIVGHGPAQLVNLDGPGPILQSKNVALIGARSIDAHEKKTCAARVLSSLRCAIDEHGMRGVINRAIDAVSDGTSGFHVSLDIDFLDPSEAPGVGTPCPGGATYREAHLAMELIADSGLMRSFEVVEVNPILDTANRTGRLAVELAMSALGKRIP